MRCNCLYPLRLPVLLGTVLLLAASFPEPVDGQSVTGRAYGVYATTLSGSVTQSPMAVLPSISGTDGDVAAAQADALTVGGVLSTSFLRSITSGALGTPGATAQSVATTGVTTILNGLITAQSITAVAASHRTSSGAVSSAAGSSIADLIVAGSHLTTGDGIVPPNTRVDLPGVGYVVVNEQISSGDGVTSTGLTVNMLHVYLQSPLGNTGEIIIGSATSSIGS